MNYVLLNEHSDGTAYFRQLTITEREATWQVESAAGNSFGNWTSNPWKSPIRRKTGCSCIGQKKERVPTPADDMRFIASLASSGISSPRTTRRPSRCLRRNSRGPRKLNCGNHFVTIDCNAFPSGVRRTNSSRRSSCATPSAACTLDIRKFHPSSSCTKRFS